MKKNIFSTNLLILICQLSSSQSCETKAALQLKLRQCPPITDKTAKWDNFS